jgi:hypothetical protein
MPITAIPNHFRCYDVNRAELEAAVTSNNLPVVVITEDIQRSVRDNVSGRGRYDFATPNWCPNFPMLACKTTQGTVILTPWNGGGYGWKISFAPNFRTELALPLVLSRNSETLYGLPVIAHSIDVAAMIGLAHGEDHLKMTNWDGCYWSTGEIFYKAVPPITAAKKTAKAA